MTNPVLINTPFAANGDKNTILDNERLAPNNPTWSEGWDAVTSTPINSGGEPPKREDFNGVLYAITDNIVHQSKGLGYEFDSAFATKIGGYPLGAKLRLTDGTEVISTIANNTNNPNSDMTGWMIPTGGINSVDSIDDLLATSNPKDGQTFNVLSYNSPNYALLNPFSGGGLFTFNSSKSSLNDGGLVMNGWCRQWDGCTVHVDWFGADSTGNQDSTQAVINAIKSVSGRTDSPFIAKKPTCTIEYGAGLYMQGDVPLVSCVHFKGQGSTITQIIPNSTGEYIFKTVGSYEGEVITSDSRLVFCNLSGMTLGYGYVNAVPMANASCGGMHWEATSWCHLDDINFCGIGGIAFRLTGVWDSNFGMVTFFNNGYATNSPSLVIEPVFGSVDGSNAITFTRSHFEGNYQHFQILKNSRHIFFNFAKIEAFTAPSDIYDPQGVYFNNLESSSHDKTKPLIGHHSTDGYTPFVVEYNNPSFFGAGYYLYSDADYPVKINGGSSKEAEMIANGKNFRISNHYGYFCGNNFINVYNSTLFDCEFKYTRMGSEADDIKDSIIMGGNSKVKNLTIEGIGTSTSNGRAFLNADSSVTIVDSTFMAGSQYAIRGTSSENKYNNTAVTQLFSDNSAKKSLMLNVGNGNQYGGVNSHSVSVPRDTLTTVSNIVSGSTLIQTRADNLCNCVLLADSWSGATLLGKSSEIDIVVDGTVGVVNDGKIYIYNTGSDLMVMNRTPNNFDLYLLSSSVVI